MSGPLFQEHGHRSLQRRLIIQIKITTTIKNRRPPGQMKPPPELDHPTTMQDDDEMLIASRNSRYSILLMISLRQ